jgi:hypothetical protein
MIPGRFILAKILREAAKEIDKHGYQVGRSQGGNGEEGLTILAAIKKVLGFKLRASLPEMGDPTKLEVRQYAALIHTLNTYVGARTFAQWCDSQDYTTRDAKRLLNGLAQAIEDGNTSARWIEPTKKEKKGHGQSGSSKTHASK